MKKHFVIALLILVSASCLFGETNSKKALIGIHNFVTEPSKNWNLMDGHFTHIDPINEEYQFLGSFMVKVLLSNSRYDFTCTIKNTGDDLIVELSNMESYACDKNGDFISSSRVSNTSNRVASQYEQQIKDEILARISNIADSEVDTLYTKVVTRPEIVWTIAESMSELAVKKFFETNVNGKEVELDVTLVDIDENRHPITDELLPLCYQARGSVPVYMDGFGRFIVTTTRNIDIYSSNDKLLTAREGSSYKTKGKLELKHLGDGYSAFWSYSVSEE